MSEAGCYSLHLYCDQDNPAHGYGEFPYEYTGQTLGECKRHARRQGWKFHRDQTHTCPRCNGKAPTREPFNPFAVATGAKQEQGNADT